MYGGCGGGGLDRVLQVALKWALAAAAGGTW